MCGGQGEGKAVRAVGTVANFSPVGGRKPLKASDQNNLKAQCENKYEEIKPWESGR